MKRCEFNFGIINMYNFARIGQIKLRDINFSISFKIHPTRYSFQFVWHSFVHFGKLCTLRNERNSKFCISFQSRRKRGLQLGDHVTEFQITSLPPLLPFFGRDSNYNFTLRLCFTGLLLRDSMYVRACLTFAETHTCPPRCNCDTFPPNVIHEFWINVLFTRMGPSLHIIIYKFVRFKQCNFSFSKIRRSSVNLANYFHFHLRSAILNRWICLSFFLCLSLNVNLSIVQSLRGWRNC